MGVLSMPLLAGLMAPAYAQSPPDTHPDTHPDTQSDRASDVAADLDGLCSESEEERRAAAVRVGEALDTHYATSVVWVLARIGTDDAVAAIRSFQRRVPEIPIDPTSLGEVRGVIDEEDPYEAIQLEVEAALEYARDRHAER